MPPHEGPDDARAAAARAARASYDRAITLVEGVSEQRWLAARRDAQR